MGRLEKQPTDSRTLERCLNPRRGFAQKHTKINKSCSEKNPPREVRWCASRENARRLQSLFFPALPGVESGQRHPARSASNRPQVPLLAIRSFRRIAGISCALHHQGRNIDAIDRAQSVLQPVITSITHFLHVSAAVPVQGDGNRGGE